MWGALSDERTGRLQLLLALAGAVILGCESRGTRDHIFVASYDSQGYGGGIRPRLHTGVLPELNEFCHLYSRGTDTHHRKHMSRYYHPPLRDVTAETEKNSLLYCCVLDRVYKAFAWQRVDEIRYNMYMLIPLSCRVADMWRIHIVLTLNMAVSQSIISTKKNEKVICMLR
jgi:hypothetical protein